MARTAIDAAKLMRAAEDARRNAHAPYSRFHVGAALQARSGRVFLGCNVENASYGLTICAERNAVFQAVSAGETEFVAIAVAGPPGSGTPPCGACRQVLNEFAPHLPVIYRGAKGRVRTTRLDRLLPEAFGFRQERRK
jgi:cytidine deaminase